MSACGPTRTSQNVSYLSEMRTKADIRQVDRLGLLAVRLVKRCKAKTLSPVSREMISVDSTVKRVRRRVSQQPRLHLPTNVFRVKRVTRSRRVTLVGTSFGQTIGPSEKFGL
jgi:hypothetical protein